MKPAIAYIPACRQRRYGEADNCGVLDFTATGQGATWPDIDNNPST